MPRDIPTRFDNTKEPEIYEAWEKSGVFAPQGGGEPFSISMPPPNITGDLHMGHALVISIQDTIVRNRRRRGFKTLYLPGADHAAIAVQNLVEKKLAKEGQDRKTLGREAFLKEVWNWIELYKPRNQDYAKKLGVSCDWNRFRFTMDEDYQEAVAVAFQKLYDKGLIYQDRYLVNWDVKLQTAISDEEVVREEVAGHLYHIKYGELVVATTRPETKLGDTALAVNPADTRYQKFVGQEIEFTNELGEKQKLPVIADEAVELEFGTGVLKVTPAHDPTDWEIGKRHQLEIKQVIDNFGKITGTQTRYDGLKVAEARSAILEDLEKQGLLVKTENITISQPRGDRSNSIIEPIPSKQWFMRTTALVDQARELVKSGQIKFVQKNMETIYFHWLDKMHDWCISRQIWWGHQIPVWYRGDQIVVGDQPTDGGWEQDPDVLDTWFSSGLWPFATLSWPKETDDLKTFYPTSLMETGTDILPFWVIRMIFMAIALDQDVPFEQVLFHGMVLDKDGKKMSKSKGNVTDPLDLIEKHGADALRMTLIGGTASGQSQKFSEDAVKKYRNFVTKIWNASRFIVLLEDESTDSKMDDKEQEFVDKLAKLEANNTKLLDTYQINIALDELYEFFWNDFCSDMIEYEKSKPTPEKKLLLESLQRLLAMLSDFAPYVTFEVQNSLLNND